MKELQRAADMAGLEMEFLELRQDALRYRWLRNRPAEVVLSGHGPSAGAWIDCESEDGTLTLLTDEDADKTIDAEMAEK